MSMFSNYFAYKIDKWTKTLQFLSLIEIGFLVYHYDLLMAVEDDIARFDRMLIAYVIITNIVIVMRMVTINNESRYLGVLKSHLLFLIVFFLMYMVYIGNILPLLIYSYL